VAKHVGMRLELEPGGIGGALHHPGEASRSERGSPLADEGEGRGLAFPLEKSAPQDQTFDLTASSHARECDVGVKRAGGHVLLFNPSRIASAVMGMCRTRTPTAL
jgi:hypothetical protein